MTFDKLPEFAERGRNGPVRRHWVKAVSVATLFGVVAAVSWQMYLSHRAEKRERQEALVRRVADVDNARREFDLAASAEAGERMRRLEALLRAERARAEIEPGGLELRMPEIQRLEGELSRLLAVAKQQLSASREHDFAQLSEAGDRAGAERALREAWELQREVNRSAPDLIRDRAREARLERDLNQLVGEPLRAEIAASLARADAALKAESWDEALAEFRAARSLQDRLNREFPRTRFSDLALIARIDAEIAALDAEGLDARVAESWETGRRLAAAGREEAAAEALAKAAEAQRSLNERFSKSRFVSMERLERIEADRQTLLASSAWRDAASLTMRARGHLQRRQVFQAQELLREAGEKIAGAFTRYPNARGADEALRLRLSFLNARSGELAAIQDGIFDRLLPLAGHPGRALLRGKVRQEEFVRIMNQNPSRTPGREFAVDSISATEAAEFCERLGWILGLKVRLPSADEMRAAVRDAAAGFENVAGGSDEEWIGAADQASAQAAVWNAAEQRAGMAPASARSAARGFRVVVEVDLTAPLAAH